MCWSSSHWSMHRWDAREFSFFVPCATCLDVTLPLISQARGARILCEVAGGAFTCDAHHLTEPRPEGDGVALCIQRALQDAGMHAEEIEYVNAHATSTPAGDLAEYRAIMKGLRGWKGKMNATKGQIGHLLGAAGGVEAIACVKAIETGEVHPNINLEVGKGVFGSLRSRCCSCLIRSLIRMGRCHAHCRTQQKVWIRHTWWASRKNCLDPKQSCPTRLGLAGTILLSSSRHSHNSVII